VTQQPTLAKPDTPLYKLIAGKLGRDPVELIHERRQQTPPVSFAQIADEFRQVTGEYLTHELPRRWYQLSIGQPVRRSGQAKPADSADTGRAQAA
jgi:hypothetical protein